MIKKWRNIKVELEIEGRFSVYIDYNDRTVFDQLLLTRNDKISLLNKI